jgi:hypothetical protein
MIDESFNNKLRLLGCRIASKGENRVKIACNSHIWDIVFSPSQYLPTKPGMAMSGYGHCDCEQKVITINRDLPVPVQKYVVIHELTHCLGYPEESEAHLRAIGLQPQAVPYLAKTKGRQLTLKGLSVLEKFPKQLERGMEDTTKKGATDVEKFLESAADDVRSQTEYIFGIDRSRPRRTLGEEEWGTGVLGEEATERVVRRLSGLSNVGRMFSPEW